MALHDEWAAIVASALDWEQAHANFDHSIKGLAPELRGRRPDNFPHSVWQLVDHIRATQYDLLEFCRNPAYEEMKWPDDYWPKNPAPASDDAWGKSIDSIHRDVADFKQFAVDHASMLGDKIPHGTGQTYLRTIIVSVDHTSYHVGQILAVRRLLNAWTES